VHGAAVRGFGCRRDPVSGEGVVVNRVLVALGVVLDRAAGQPGRHRKADRFGHAVWIVGEAVLQVGRNRQVSAGRDPLTVAHRLVAADVAVGPAERGSESTARRGEGRETQGGEQQRRSAVPRVRHKQRLFAAVQGKEPGALLTLARHTANLSGVRAPRGTCRGSRRKATGTNADQGMRS
jgi:hypothetical protein